MKSMMILKENELDDKIISDYFTLRGHTLKQIYLKN